MPAATMYLMVSSDEPSKLLRMPSALLEKRAYSGQTSSTWSRKQWPVPSSSRVSRLSSSALIELALRERVAGRHRHHERLVVERRDRQAGVGERLGQDRAIELAGAQHVEQARGEVFLQHERHLRHRGDRFAHQIGQQIGTDGVDHADPQRPGDRILAALGDLLDRRRLLDHLLRLAHDLLAERGHADLARAAFEQLDVELLLELLDRHAQGRLRDETGLGGAPEMALPRHGDDVAQLGQRHAAEDSAAVTTSAGASAPIGAGARAGSASAASPLMTMLIRMLHSTISAV